MFNLKQKSGGCKFVINEPLKLPPINTRHTRPMSQQIPRPTKECKYRPLSQRSPVRRQQMYAQQYQLNPLDRLKMLQKLKRLKYA